MIQADLQEFFSSGKFACSGSTATPARERKLMYRLGRAITLLGGVIVTGHSTAADLAFEAGAIEGDPSNLVICLPWLGFGSKQALHPQAKLIVFQALDPALQQLCYRQAAATHSAWDLCTPGAKLFYGRNVLLGDEAKLGITYSYPGLEHFLTKNGCPYADLFKPETFQEWNGFSETLETLVRLKLG